MQRNNTSRLYSLFFKVYHAILYNEYVLLPTRTRLRKRLFPPCQYYTNQIPRTRPTRPSPTLRGQHSPRCAKRSKVLQNTKTRTNVPSTKQRHRQRRQRRKQTNATTNELPKLSTPTPLLSNGRKMRPRRRHRRRRRKGPYQNTTTPQTLCHHTKSMSKVHLYKGRNHPIATPNVLPRILSNTTMNVFNVLLDTTFYPVH